MSQTHNVALVAGATGIVGSQLVTALRQQDWQVIGLTRQPAMICWMRNRAHRHWPRSIK